MNDPIQARVSNGIYAPVPKATPRRNKHQSITESEIDLIYFATMMSMAILFAVSMIKMSVGDSGLLMEYYNLPVSQCHVTGGSNYTITPLVFNTTLMYRSH